ncbi:MAG: ABC transporter permease [Gemmataceae bacterium]
MTKMTRYWRLLLALARFSLAQELAFRGNFLIKITVEVLWLGILLIFYRTIFSRTSVVADWSEYQYLFFIGCYYALDGLIETLFLANCNDFANLIRTGDLDFILLKPIDEQFLISCRGIDWSTAPNLLLGIGVMAMSLWQMGWQPNLAQTAAFVALFLCGAVMTYCFLLVLMSTSVWLIRNQSLFELWWLFTSLVRYPREVFTRGWAAPVGWFFTFIVPVMLVINVPARIMVKTLEPAFVAYTVAATLVMLVVSRRFFYYALRRYRSASS